MPEQFDDPNQHQALAFAHYVDAYEVFLKGADVYPEQERVVEERYGRSRKEQIYRDADGEHPQQRRMRTLCLN